MIDPRLNGSHLTVARRDQYEAAVDELLEDRGPLTTAADPLARPPAHFRGGTSRPVPVGDGLYMLIRLDDGRQHSLRVGINSLGRLSENDLVLKPNHISRRHCVVVVHATGGCEVYDTASRNGTWVNGCRIGRRDLLPGDVLILGDEKFLVAWFAADGQNSQSRASQVSDTFNGMSPTQ